MESYGFAAVIGCASARLGGVIPIQLEGKKVLCNITKTEPESARIRIAWLKGPFISNGPLAPCKKLLVLSSTLPRDAAPTLLIGPLFASFSAFRGNSEITDDDARAHYI